MKRSAVSCDAGRLELLLDHADLAPAAVALALAHARSPDSEAGPIDFAGRPAWFKSSRLAGRARWRHAAARILLRAPPPRVREAHNLAWLDARLFQVPRPLAAGWLGGAAPRWQFLVTERVDARPLDSVLREGSRDERCLLLGELARECARMHALHFVHRDLFWRNVLVQAPRAGRRLVFTDAWRGGERLQARGAAYDLACLFLEAPSLLGSDELHDWLAQYRAERAALGHPLPESTWRSADRARRGLLARARREPGRWRIPEAPVQEFDFAAAIR